MATLSVVLATFNEEKNLAACLDSVKDLADEIVIVDGGSTDKTVEIAKKYGAKVILTDNPSIFHINKQKAIDKATKDWVLQLDADERVTKELVEEIEQILEKRHPGGRRPIGSHGDSIASPAKPDSLQNDNGINGYWIPRKNLFLGRYLMKGGQYPDFTLRLYKRGKGRLPQKSVHEQAVVEGEVGYLKNPLIHIADPSFSRYLLRFERYTDLIRDELTEKKVGNSPYTAGKYLLILPSWWFLLTYIRHKGFMDSWQGFVFSFFSSLRFPVAYIKYLSQKSK